VQVIILTPVGQTVTPLEAAHAVSEAAALTRPGALSAKLSANQPAQWQT
jgi:hypothetical protein